MHPQVSGFRRTLILYTRNRMHMDAYTGTNAHYPGHIVPARVHTPGAHTRAHPHLHTDLRECPPYTCTHAFTPLACTHLPIRAHLYARTHTGTEHFPALQEPPSTYCVPKCEPGRSVLPPAPNGICIHGSPQPWARGRGGRGPLP